MSEMKKCLIAIDYQVDFVTGTLGFEKAKSLDGIIAEKIDNCRKGGGEIIFTFDTHYGNYLYTLEGRHLPIAHCTEGTEGHRLYGKTASRLRPGDKYFFKSSFGSAELFDYLRSKKFESIELCGVVTDICVISNAVLAKTAQPETEIIVDSRAVASNDDCKNQAALDVMSSLQIMVI